MTDQPVLCRLKTDFDFYGVRAPIGLEFVADNILPDGGAKVILGRGVCISVPPMVFEILGLLDLSDAERYELMQTSDNCRRAFYETRLQNPDTEIDGVSFVLGWNACLDDQE